MSVEDRLRATTGAVTEAMRPIRPLNLRPVSAEDSAPGSLRRARRQRGQQRRWPGWLIPLAAAVAVIAVAATLVGVRGLSRPAATSTVIPEPLPYFNPNVPRYYVALGTVGSVRNAFLGDTYTGKRLATFQPPAKFAFNGVAASSDDKTFVFDALSGDGWGAGTPRTGTTSHAWYVLRLSPGSAKQARLTRIPIASSFTAAEIAGVAVSPDGSTLAILFQPNAIDPPHKAPVGLLTLRFYSVATVQVLRTWTESAPSSVRGAAAEGDDEDLLSWLGDGHTLTFLYPPIASKQTIRTLDTTRPGSNLITNSRPVFSDAATACFSPRLTADGRSVICGTSTGTEVCAKEQPELVAYSVATGKLESVLYRHQGNCSFGYAQVDLAVSGAFAIGMVETFELPAETTTNVVGVLTPGKFTPLPITLVSDGYGPGTVAF